MLKTPQVQTLVTKARTREEGPDIGSRREDYAEIQILGVPWSLRFGLASQLLTPMKLKLAIQDLQGTPVRIWRTGDRPHCPSSTVSRTHPPGPLASFTGENTAQPLWNSS